MVQLDDIIEIDSSPERTPRPMYKSREKGKGKATPHRREPVSSVIELTDSESEADQLEGKAFTSCRVGPSHSNLHATPGPSSPKRTPLKSYPARRTGSLENISTPAQKNVAVASGSGSGIEAFPKQELNGQNHKPPLFLSGDEEHESPPPDTPQANATITPVIEQDPTILVPETQSHLPTASDSDPISIENIDPTSTAVAQILEIIPNVEPAHLLELIETHLPAYSVFRGNRDPDDDGGEGAAVAGEREATVEEQVQGVVGHVLHHLFENPDYPKAEKRAGGKRKGKSAGDSDHEDDLEGKGKGKAKDHSSKKLKIDYASIDRPFTGGPNYFDLALVCPSLP